MGRVITTMFRYGWIPMKIANLLSKSVTLKHNSKVADVLPCIAVEDFNLSQNHCLKADHDLIAAPEPNISNTDLKAKIAKLGLSDLDTHSCQASFHSRQKLVDLIEQFEDIFSRHPPDCGEAKCFVHYILLTLPHAIPQGASSTLSEVMPGPV